MSACSQHCCVKFCKIWTMIHRLRVYFFIYAFDRNISKRRVSSSSLIERSKGFEGSLHDGVRTVPYRGNGNCRGGRLSASSRPSLIAVLSFGSTASSSLIQLSVIRRNAGGTAFVRLPSSKYSSIESALSH